MTMEAGEALDRLVAERVMGWEPREDGYYWHRYTQECPMRSWSPSTNIAHAWEVVECMRSRQNQFDVHLFGEYGTAFTCVFACGPARFDGRAPTAQLAICHAAVNAILHKSKP